MLDGVGCLEKPRHARLRKCPSARSKEDKMKSLAICAALIGGFGALVFMGTVASTVPASAKCFVDEGNGRRTPCEAMYKKHKPSVKTSKAKKDVKPK
jgi:hypothetical protein